jgi:dolichol-phosphate mannosyltransferase
MAETPRRVAYVLPVYNEGASLGRFHAELVQCTEGRPDLTFEFLYVDDGSRDDSLSQLLELRAADDRVSVLSLSRNYGHQLAVTAGLDAAADAGADAVVVMDVDLQDPPAVSLELIEVWEQGADVVYAQRRTRRDPWFKRTTASAFYWLLERLASSEIPPNVGDFRLMDKRVVGEVVKFREQNRFLRGIVASVGFRQEAVLFDRDARFAGKSGYSLRRMVKLALDGILGFSTTPLKLITRLGLLISFLSIVGACYVFSVKVFTPENAVPGWAFLGVGVFLLGGIQLIMMGIIGSYVGRVYVEVQQRPLYSVAVVARGSESDTQTSVTPSE